MKELGRREVFTALLVSALLASCSGRGHAVLPPSAAQRITRTASVGDAYQSAVLADAPTAYYRLDDTGTTAADSSGNGLAGTIGASVTKGVTGLLASSSDSAVSLPGTASSAGAVVVPQTSKLQPSSSVSIEAWLKFSATPASYTVPVAYGSDYNYAPYDLYFYSGKIVAQFYLTTGVLTVTSPTALTVNTAYYVAATFDGSTARLYINGSQVATAVKTGTLTGYTNGYGLAIGDDAAFTDPAYKGTVDEVAIYAGNALSATQIQNHYNAGTSTAASSPSPSPSPTAVPTASPSTAPTATPTPPPGGDQYRSVVVADGPVAYYRLDDTGSAAADSSGNGLNGTVGSSVTEDAPGLLSSSTDTAMTLPGAANSGGAVVVKSNAKFQTASALTLELWLSFSSTPANYTVPIAYGSDYSYAPYDLYFISGKIALQLYLSTGVLVVTSSSALVPNTHYYVAATFDGSVARLYINGAQVASGSKSGTITGYNSNYGLAIGDDAGFSDPAFKGTVDEAAVYAKALAASQIQNHYNAGAGSGPVSTPTPAPTSTPTAGLIDWSTMGFDLARTGYNPNENRLGTGSFGTLHAYWSSPAQVGYGTIGEPVVAANVSVNGQTHNVLYVGSSYSGMFDAIDADTGAVIWSKQLGQGTYSCGTGSSHWGVAGAAVLDRSRNRVYVADGVNQVHALDLATGSESAGWPISIAASNGHDFVYAGLTYNSNNGLLYAETSTTCDISPWYGRISAIAASSGSIVGTFYPMQGSSGAGIWGFGGASVDPTTNNVFIATGNADGTPQNAQYAEQVVELSADLSTVIAHNYPNLPNSPDADFGATPLLFQPPGCPPLVAAINKSGLFVLYNRTSINSGPIQVIPMSVATDSGDFVGVPAYDPVTNYVYVGLPATYGIYKPGAGAFSIQTNCTLNPTPVWNAVFGPDGATTTNDTPRSPITIANGVLYVAAYTDQHVYAFNASTGTQLWSAPLTGNGIVGPVIVNGHLYVGDMNGEVQAWTP